MRDDASLAGAKLHYHALGVEWGPSPQGGKGGSLMSRSFSSDPQQPADATSLAASRLLYRWQAPVYDQTRWFFLRGRSAAVRMLELQAGEHALEVGCGTGSNLLGLRRLVGDAGTVQGLDSSPHMLAQARAKLARRGWPNVQLHEGDAGHFDLGRPLDAILYSYSLSMIPAWRASLAAARRHLAPGGRLVIVDFGDLRGCGIVRRLLLRWLRAHHVESQRPYAEALGEIFGTTAVETRQGTAGWYFLARCRTPRR